MILRDFINIFVIVDEIFLHHRQNKVRKISPHLTGFGLGLAPVAPDSQQVLLFYRGANGSNMLMS